MPNVGGPVANLSDFIAAVQTNMFELLLSKSDAESIYQTRAAANAAAAAIASNASAISTSIIADVNLLSNISGVAPRGQSDLWTVPPGLTASCESLIYFADINKLYGYSGSLVSNGANYSSDGGLTWSAITTDVPFTTAVIVGYNGSDKFVALSIYGGTTRIYSSSNGTSFTAGAMLASETIGSSIPWFNNLFITGIHTDATHWISTSPDGVTWTPRLTPDFTGTGNYIGFATDGTQLIAVGDGYVGAARTFDGISWHPTFGITTSISTIAYSSDQNLWLCLSPNGVGFTSTDGLNWTNVGTIWPATGAVGLTWVGDGINRWYLAGPSPSLNYGLWSTNDPRTTSFFNVSLDGALIDAQSYSFVLYLPTYNRFVMGLTGLKFAYSTPRIRDIKASSDNIRVRNSPVTTSKYSGTADFTIASTVTETLIIPSTSIGSLAYQAQQPVGMKINISLVMQNTSAAGDTLTLRFKTQSGTLLTHTIPVAGGATNLVTLVKASFVVRTATLSCCSTVSQSLMADSSVYAIPAYNPAILNTFSVTAQWGAALSTCTVNQFNISTDFINGA
jgi:hypothetical protein